MLKELLDKGNTCYKEKNHITSLEFYKKALKINPYSPEILNNMGVLYSSLGRFDMASLYYGHALEKSSDSFYILNNLAGSLIKQSRTEEAIDCYRKALRLKPESGEIYYNLAAALYKTHKYDEAFHYAVKASELSPGEYRIYNLLGLICLKKEITDKAIEYFQKSAEIFPGAISRIYLGKAFHKKGETAQALIHYKEALKMDPSSPCIYKYMGDLYKDIKKFKQSIRYYQKAMETKIGEGSEECESARIMFRMAGV